MMMYVLMFAAGIALRYTHARQPRPFKVFSGNLGMWVVGIMGLVGCFITLLVGFFPPATLDVGGKIHYEVVFSLSLIAMLLPVALFYFYKNKKGSLVAGAA
jgi:amino acid transporter